MLSLTSIVLSFIQNQDLPGDRPLFVGISGPQGCGKTTLAQELQSQLSKLHQVAILSLDDVYLTHKDQIRLSSCYSGNPLVKYRGQPGTHDIALCLSILCNLKEGIEVAIPRYDKSAFQGRGDRCPTDQWHRTGKVDIVLFEGWCLGFQPLHQDDLEQAKNKDPILGAQKLEHLKFVNEQLRQYKSLWEFLDVLVSISAEDLNYVYNWRQQAESALWKSSNSGMTQEQVKEFIDAYMPAYKLYKPAPNDINKSLQVVLNLYRQVTQVNEESF